MNFKQACLLSLLTNLLWLAPVYADDISDTSEEFNRMQYYPIGEHMDMVTKVDFQYAKPRITVKAVYPELQSDNPDDESIDNFDTAVLDVVQKSIDDFKNQAKLNSATNVLKKNKPNNNLYIDYATSSIKVGDSYIVSVRFNTQGILAGLEHPYHVHRVLNYDLNTDEALELSDLFDPDTDYLQVLADYASTHLSRRLKNATLIEEGTAPKEGNYQNWNLKPDGLFITFDEGQVAPAIYGAQTVLIPYPELADIVSEESPIAICVEKPKKCARNKVLTGGFIDEAAKKTTRLTA